MKDKHVKLKLAAAISLSSNPDAALATTPRCDPDSAALRRSDLRAATENREPGPENSSWRRNITFDALGWHMAERFAQSQLLPGDTLDIAYSLDHNDHPEYGGLELSLRDFKSQAKTAEDAGDAEGKRASAAL